MVDKNTTTWSDRQFIARKHNGGLEQVNIELVFDIILEEEEEEEEDSFYQWADKYDQWDNNPYTLVFYDIG